LSFKTKWKDNSNEFLRENPKTLLLLFAAIGDLLTDEVTRWRAVIRAD
jgi:hypothetical protein